MFEIGFPELVLIAIVGLLVIGPERLPEALRTLGLWLGRLRRSFTTVKAEIEKEIGMDEVKRQLHNEAIMEEMKRIESEVKGTASAARASLNEGVQAATDLPKIDPGAQPDAADVVAAQDNLSAPQPPEASGSEAPEQAQASSEPETSATDQAADEHADAADRAGRG